MSGSLGAADLFDLDSVSDIDVTVDVTPLLGGDVQTSAFLHSSQSSTFSLSFSSSSSGPLWRDMTRPARTHSINQELRLCHCT